MSNTQTEADAGQSSGDTAHEKTSIYRDQPPRDRHVPFGWVDDRLEQGHALHDLRP